MNWQPPHRTQLGLPRHDGYSLFHRGNFLFLQLAARLARLPWIGPLLMRLQLHVLNSAPKQMLKGRTQFALKSAHDPANPRKDREEQPEGNGGQTRRQRKGEARGLLQLLRWVRILCRRLAMVLIALVYILKRGVFERIYIAL